MSRTGAAATANTTMRDLGRNHLKVAGKMVTNVAFLLKQVYLLYF
jgi:hypothetical protein